MSMHFQRNIVRPNTILLVNDCIMYAIQYLYIYRLCVSVQPWERVCEIRSIKARLFILQATVE